MRLKDKAVIVTGSTTGIGEAIARRCAAEGARVLVHGRDAQRGEQVAASIGPSATVHIDDLSDPEAPPRLVDAAVQRLADLYAVANVPACYEHRYGAAGHRFYADLMWPWIESQMAHLAA